VPVAVAVGEVVRLGRNVLGCVVVVVVVVVAVWIERIVLLEFGEGVVAVARSIHHLLVAVLIFVMEGCLVETVTVLAGEKQEGIAAAANNLAVVAAASAPVLLGTVSFGMAAIGSEFGNIALRSVVVLEQDILAIESVVNLAIAVEFEVAVVAE